MNPANFLVVFILTGSVTALCCLRPSKSLRYLAIVTALLLLNVTAVTVVALQDRSQNLVLRLLSGHTLTDRVELASHFAAACLGVLSGLTFIAATANRWRALFVTLLFGGSTTGLALIAARDVISPYLSEPGASGGSGFVKREAAPGWRVRKLIDLNLSPAAICCDGDQALLVSGYAGGYLQHGTVVRIRLGDGKPTVEPVASGMTRPHGVASFDGDVYVSRAGQYARAVGGRLVQESTGAVTRIRDLSGDGVYDHFEDIVSGLPGAQLPDGLHQNNAIVFTPDGKLMITVGTPTDHAPPLGDHDGTILRCNPDGSDLEVFAHGFRNPFGITVGPGQQLFATDNDPNVADLGDKLVWLQQGKHYGHPYDAHDRFDVEGITPPLLKLASAQGLAYMPPGTGTEIDDRLLVASFSSDTINSIVVDLASQPPEASVEFLASVPSVVALCTSESGHVYACSYADRAIYEIYPARDR